MNPSAFPKISIVTPSFNQGEFLEATIKSVLNQEYPNLEYIIVDGGSTDGSIEIIKRYEKNLHFWCSERDGGHYDAVNKGFSYATGEIMAWLNSDDMYYPWALRTVASIMSQLPNVRWLTTLTPGIWDREGFCVRMKSVSGYSKESFLKGFHMPGDNTTSLSCIQQESSFWRRSLWNEVGGHIRSQFKLAGDFDLWSRFYLYEELFGTVVPLGGFRKHKDQKSRNYLQLYLQEAEISIHEMRRILGWQSVSLPCLDRRLKLARVCPILNQLLLKDCQFRGKRVEKLALSYQWVVKEYQLTVT